MYYIEEKRYKDQSCNLANDEGLYETSISIYRMMYVVYHLSIRRVSWFGIVAAERIQRSSSIANPSGFAPVFD